MTNKIEPKLQLWMTIGLLCFNAVLTYLNAESWITGARIAFLGLGILLMFFSLLNVDVVGQKGKPQLQIGTLSRIQFIAGLSLLLLRIIPVSAYLSPAFWIQFAFSLFALWCVYIVIRNIIRQEKARRKYIAKEVKNIG